MTIATMTNRSRRFTFAYYCSGHGYGHATRVSAFARHLLSLQPQPIVHVVSSAPDHVFADSIALGALYRNADIDPVIVQPLAYRVDRSKSVEVLEDFLAKKDQKVVDESQWLKAIRADCVLSDAAFLGCIAANEAGIPSVLITNFSFDSVYSYLSTDLIDAPSKPEHPALDTTLCPPSAEIKEELDPDAPIPLQELTPLVAQIHSGYRCADLLLRLPGAIPLPSFAANPSLPSPEWVDTEARVFKAFVVDHLTQPPSAYKLLSQIPFPPHYPHKPLARQVRAAPLLVRSPDPCIYTPEGRKRLLNYIGVPDHLHNSEKTKILIVSFGGQVFYKPASRSHSRTLSRTFTPTDVPAVLAHSPSGRIHPVSNAIPSQDSSCPTHPAELAQALSDALRVAAPRQAPGEIGMGSPPVAPARTASRMSTVDGRPRNISQLRIEGAPLAAVPASPRTNTTPAFPAIPTFQAVMIPPTPLTGDEFDISPAAANGASNADYFELNQEKQTAEDIMDEADVRILPDDSWIAIVCGVSKNWGTEDGEELPENFFVAPRDVYMPDLTAVADVLLGKLGYGTVSECVDACTPFVYVPRPLFIEEHGLRLYLDQEGVGVELSRTQYEVGEWADSIEQAYKMGKDAKARKRQVGETGVRKQEGLEMAQYVVDWVGRWQAGVEEAAGEVALKSDMDNLENGLVREVLVA